MLVSWNKDFLGKATKFPATAMECLGFTALSDFGAKSVALVFAWVLPHAVHAVEP